MGSLLENLKNYFNTTPADVLEREWKEIESLNEIGPDVIEYAEYVKEYFGVGVTYSNSEVKSENRYNVSKSIENNGIIGPGAMYCLAA